MEGFYFILHESRSGSIYGTSSDIRFIHDGKRYGVENDCIVTVLFGNYHFKRENFRKNVPKEI